MGLTPELLWTCPYCGLDTPVPDLHLPRAHGLQIETVMARLDALEKERQDAARLLLMSQELGA